MSATTNVDVLADEWAQRLCMNNKVDLNLQLPAADESTKIEVGTAPSIAMPVFDKSNSNDDYLSSILTASSKVAACSGMDSCTCYKCQRQRRRNGFHNKISIATMMRSNSVRNSGTQSRGASLKRNQSLCTRKAPNTESHGHHRHSRDTIHRLHTQQPNAPRLSPLMRPRLEEHHEDEDTYEISWKDETGDDILPSLRTFQTIFDEKPREISGLSELLERRTLELKKQREEEAQMDLDSPSETASGLRSPPPPRDDCHTLSYRDGPSHRQLTLYHTMKMRYTDERVDAYDRAFLHCVRARSGLETWLSRQSARGVPEAMTSYTPPSAAPPDARRHSWGMKRGGSLRTMLHPILPGRKHRVVAEDLWIRTKGDMPTTPVHSSFGEPTTPLTDILATTQALLPSRSPLLLFRQSSMRHKPYERIDAPSRPLAHGSAPPKGGDNASTLSSAGDTSTMTARSTTTTTSKPSSVRRFASFGRRSLRMRNGNGSTHSFESKIECEDDQLTVKTRKRANTSGNANSATMTIQEIAARMASKPTSSSPSLASSPIKEEDDCRTQCRT